MHKTPLHQQRRLDALLALTGLAHWRALLRDLIDRYAGLEDLTIGPDEGARAEIVGLLRQLAHAGKGPGDLEFAHAVAELGFLEYRVCRVKHGHPDSGDVWRPEDCRLADYRAAGEVTAWPDPYQAAPPGVIARRLLLQVRRNGFDH